MSSEEKQHHEDYVNELLADRLKYLKKNKRYYFSKTICFLEQNKIDLEKKLQPKTYNLLFGTFPDTSYGNMILVIRLLQLRGSSDPDFYAAMQEAIDKLMPLHEAEQKQ